MAASQQVLQSSLYLSIHPLTHPSPPSLPSQSNRHGEHAAPTLSKRYNEGPEESAGILQYISQLCQGQLDQSICSRSRQSEDTHTDTGAQTQPAAPLPTHYLNVGTAREKCKCSSLRIKSVTAKLRAISENLDANSMKCLYGGEGEKEKMIKRLFH
jgi:hypothetical protein